MKHQCEECKRRKEKYAISRVTDHAMLRFLERGLGLEVDGFRELILNQVPKQAPFDGGYPFKYGELNLRAIMKDNIVITVVKKNKDKKKKREKIAFKEEDSAPSCIQEESEAE